MAILSETFAHDRFYQRVHAANVFIEEILEYTHVNGREIRRINREADLRVAARSGGIGSDQIGSGRIENGVQFEMVPLDEPLNLLSYKYIPYTTDSGDTAFARSSEIVEIAGVLNYNQFDPTSTATVPGAYIFPAQFAAVAEKLIEHGIAVTTLDEAGSYVGEVFAVTAIEQQRLVQNNHRNSILRGQFRTATKEFVAGDFLVAMDNRLANLIFYLLEAETDDGLAYWNFFDEYLEQQLGNADTVDFPVFKVLP
jgi:dipeptidyl-peptidase-4